MWRRCETLGVIHDRSSAYTQKKLFTEIDTETEYKYPALASFRTRLNHVNNWRHTFLLELVENFD